MLVGLVASGCGTGSVVSNRYDNFTAYYNGFYNAERVFESGRASLNTRRTEVDRTRYQPLFERPSGATGSRDFESAIAKSADLLREHPDSKWVDDALLLIGQSYFYQENFVGALQKFQEVISLDTRLRPEATFWLARTMITSGSYDEAQALLTAALLEDADRDWQSMYHLAMGELYVKQGQWEDAEAALATGLERVKDKEVGARAQFLHGQVLERLDRPEDAYRAFRRVGDFRPPYELQYAADYSAARVQGRYLDEGRALEAVRRMERDDKNASYVPEIRYLRGRILQYAGRDDEAFAVYDGVLYGSAPGTNLSGVRSRIHFALAEMYRDVDGNFVMAAAHFDSAATGTGTTGGTGRSAASGRTTRQSDVDTAPEAIRDMAGLRNAFKDYATVYLDIQRMDSLLALGSLPQEAFEARILELRQERAVELAEQQRLLNERQRERQFQQLAGAANDPFANQGLPPGKVIPGVNDGTTSNTAGFLFHEDPIRVQEGRATFRMKWGDRPLVPNWRREEAVSGIRDQVDDEAIADEGGDAEGESETLPEIDTSSVPRDSTSKSAMRRERALARYELGNTLFLNMNMPDSAAVWYRRVIEEDAGLPVAQRALYALAEVQRALGDDNAATALYRQILEEYPESDFSSRVRGRLGLEEEVISADSSGLALMAYSDVFDRWGQDPDSLVMGSFLRLAADWPEFDVAGRAMLTVARMHLEWADADSARVVGPVPAVVDRGTLERLWPAWFEVDSVSVVDSVRVDPALVDSVMVDSVMVDSALVDSVMVDSLPADSSLILPDSTAVRPDSVVVRSVHLSDLYAWVKDRFQGTDLYTAADRRSKVLAEYVRPPQAERPERKGLTAADSLALAALRGELAPPPKPAPDSTVTGRPDTLAVPEEVVAADSLENPERLDTSNRLPGAALPLETGGRYLVWTAAGNGAPAPTGFFVRIGPRLSDVDSAAFMRTTVERQLMEDSELVLTLEDREPEDPEFLVVAGPFRDRESAIAFHGIYGSTLDDDVGILQIVDVP
ncbi:MAG: tetratricopeptide repeat protein [Rhodothermales bacterium]